MKKALSFLLSFLLLLIIPSKNINAGGPTETTAGYNLSTAVELPIGDEYNDVVSRRYIVVNPSNAGEHWFKFDVTNEDISGLGTYYELRIYNLSSTNKIESVLMLQADGKTAAKKEYGSNFIDKNEAILNNKNQIYAGKIETSGIYYIVITSESGFSGDIEIGLCKRKSDVGDFNNPTKISLNKKYTKEISGLNNCDYFSFVPNKTERYKVDFKNNSYLVYNLNQVDGSNGSFMTAEILDSGTNYKMLWNNLPKYEDRGNIYYGQNLFGMTELELIEGKEYIFMVGGDNSNLVDEKRNEFGSYTFSISSATSKINASDIASNASTIPDNLAVMFDKEGYDIKKENGSTILILKRDIILNMDVDLHLNAIRDRAYYDSFLFNTLNIVGKHELNIDTSSKLGGNSIYVKNLIVDGPAVIIENKNYKPAIDVLNKVEINNSTLIITNNSQCINASENNSIISFKNADIDCQNLLDNRPVISSKGNINIEQSRIRINGNNNGIDANKVKIIGNKADINIISKEARPINTTKGIELDKSLSVVEPKNGGLSKDKKFIATTEGGTKEARNVLIKNVQAEKISLNKTSLNLDINKSETLKATISPSNTSDKTLTWTSSDTKIVTVDQNGKVTAKKAGSATITVTTSNGKKATCKITVNKEANVEACKINPNVGWETLNGKQYWYEKVNGKFIKQGIYGSKGNVWYDDIERGREIYDPCSDGWYWLDSLYDGAKAVNKEVFMPYVYSDEKNFDNDTINYLANESNIYTESHITANMGEQVKQAILNKTGKWVRYDAQGKMIKGWYTVSSNVDKELYSTQVGNTYFYDYKTGLMAKGWTNIDGKDYFFDLATGVLQK